MPFRYAVNLEWTGATGSPGVNVFHGRTTGGVNPGEDVDALGAMLEDFYTAIIDLFPSAVTISSPQEISGVGPDEGESAAVDQWSLTGTGGSSFLPPANCMLVNWMTDSGGRRGRGRSFIGPLQELVLESNGTPGEAYLAILLAAAEDLVESSDSFGNGAWGVWSRAGATFRDFTRCETPNIFGVMRSRRD